MTTLYFLTIVIVQTNVNSLRSGSELIDLILSLLSVLLLVFTSLTTNTIILFLSFFLSFFLVVVVVVDWLFFVITTSSFFNNFAQRFSLNHQLKAAKLSD